MRRPGSIFLFILLFTLRAAALEVRETVWGYDARLVPGRMNLLSVRVANPAPKTFDGVLKLRESGGVGVSNGAPYLQPVFLSPNTERWVQFTVFIGAGYEQFTLEWDRGGPAQIVQATTGPPARVILTEASGAFAAPSQVRGFSDALFPTTVAATDGLDGLALDYVPRWEPLRREALIDWVWRGGTLLVLRGADGEFPRFTEQLAALNTATDSARLGAGHVLRLPITRRELTEKTFSEHGFPAPEIRPPSTPLVYNLEQTIFQRLATLTRPEIRWWLINSLSFLYVVLIGPVHFFWGRRIDYRVSIGAFVACVGIFGVLFSVIGRRGYGEAQTVHSLSIARALQPGRFDVTQWLSAFATRGDEYSLTHRAPANLYATVSSGPTNGAVVNGKDGRFLADIPLFSSRQFTHRAVMPGADVSVTVERWEEDAERLKALVLKTNAAFPPDPVEVRVRFRDRFYLMQRNGADYLLAESAQAESFATFLPQFKVQVAMSAPPVTVSSPVDKQMLAALPLLYVRALDGQSYFQQAIEHGPQPAGQLQLFVFARSPESFRLQGEGFASEVGYTLYVQEVIQP